MERYYPPSSPIDFTLEPGYQAPAWDAVDFVIPYHAPAPGAVDFVLQPGYQAPAWNQVKFGGDSSTTVDISLAASGPAASVQVQVSPQPLLPIARIDATGPAASVSLSITPAVPVYPLSIDAAGPAAAVQLQIDPQTPSYSLSISATGQAASPTIQIAWGQEVPRATLTGGGVAGAGGAGTQMGWNDAPSKPRELTSRHQNAVRIDSHTASGWEQGSTVDAAPVMPHSQIPALDLPHRQPWGTLDARDQSGELPHQVPPANDRDSDQPWGTFTAHDRDSGQPYGHPPAKDEEKLQRYWHVDWFADPPRPLPEEEAADPDAYTVPLWHSVDFVLIYSAYQPPAADQIDFGAPETALPAPPPNKAIHPVQPGVGIGHAVMPTIDQGNRQPWGAGSWTRPYPDYGPGITWPNEPDEPAPRPPQPIIQEVYIYMPNITLYRLPDGAEFEATSVTLSSDRDSWGWTLNANLKRDTDLNLIKPTANGPVEIGCEINGHAFTFLVESYSRTRQVGNSHYTINGRSRTAWLTEPYAPKRSKALTAGYSAAALAGQELSNTGFTLAWNATDWLIPAGAYSYENLTPIGAIKRLAEAAGYMLQSHPELQQLIVSPRYRVDPHKWTEPTTALDAILPADLITQEGGNFRTKPAYNRAIVTGGPAGGVIVTVTREGTAGDILAPMVTDDLITHSDAGYQRGRSLIAEGGTWEEMSITTMLTPDNAPGLLLPGQLVEIQDTADTYPVIIDGTTITATSSDTEIKVRQQLAAERRIG